MTNLKGKKLLVLAGAGVHVKVVEAAKEMGVYTIVTDYLENSPAKQIADEKWMLNITDIDEIVEKCKKENVDGILNFCIDPGQRPYQKICEKLGLPCFGNEKQFLVLTDKKEFKKFCIKTGVDIIPEYTTEDIKNNKAEYPVLIKPVDSRGSRGISVCRNRDEGLEGIIKAAKESSNGQVVIEKYMEGKQDFSMTYFVIDGDPNLVRIGDRYLGRKEDNLNKQCIFSVSPSRNTGMYLKKVHKRVVHFIRELGIKNGPVFMQGFVDGDTVRFYDPGLRFPGTDYEKLFLEATNINLMKMCIEFALAGKIKNQNETIKEGYKLCGKYCAQMFVSAKPGRIKVFRGLEKIAQNKCVVKVDQRYFEGEIVPQSGDVKQRIAEIVILAKGEMELKETVKWIYDTLEVYDENDEPSIVSCMDINMI